jgi:N-acetylneuraminic acid mutarotase
MIRPQHLLTIVGTSTLFLASCGEQSPTAPEPGRSVDAVPELAVTASGWAQRADMPTPRFSLAAGAVDDASGSILYAIGGMSNEDSDTRHSLATVEAYNVATNTWTTKASLPVPLQETNGVGRISGKLYISGGYNLVANSDGPVQSKALYMYNPRLDTWTRKADMPHAVNRGITGVIDGKLYVLVGECRSDGCPTAFTRRLWRYDPATNKWDLSLPSCPGSHSRGAGGVINGKFYVVGGGGPTNVAGDRLHVFDPATNSWTEKARLPAAEYSMAAAVKGGRLWVVGGGSTVDPWTGAVYAYTPATNKWTQQAPMPTPRTALAAASSVRDGQVTILAVGGRGEIHSPSANEAFGP